MCAIDNKESSSNADAREMVPILESLMAKLQSETLFETMAPFLKTPEGAAVVKKIQAVYHFELSAKKGDPPAFFTVDLKNGNGSVSKGKVGTADATFIMLDEDFMGVAKGTLNPQTAFMQGKMRIRGNMGKAAKFTPDIIPKNAKL